MADKKIKKYNKKMTTKSMTIPETIIDDEEIKSSLPNDINVFEMTPEEINFEMKYPIKKEKSNITVVCPLCNKKYSKRNANKHRQTKVHQAYEQLNQKMIRILRLIES